MPKKVSKSLAIAAFVFMVIVAGAQQRGHIIIADFENDSYGNWKVEGDAFGSGPPKRIPDAIGKGLVNTSSINSFATGTLTSQPFKVERRYLVFLLGGVTLPEQVCVNLLQEGKVVRTATGNNNVHTFRTLEWRFFDLEDLKDKEVQIQILDRAKENWEYLMADQFYLSNEVPVEKNL
ncbi:MAG: hypothetical protein WKG06_06700 [Segetibacter sp.]